MPSKSTIKQNEPRVLTRTAILREYGLSDQTLRRLIDSLELLKLPAVTEHGKVLYEINAQNDFVLRLAKLCPFSFNQFRPPMLRYILLGCLTGEDDDVVDGLANRGFDNRFLSKDIIHELRLQILVDIPAEMLDIVKLARAPSTEAESLMYAQLLAIIGVTALYQSPDVLEQFYFSDASLIHFLHQILWTHSSSAEIKAALINNTTGAQTVTAEGLLLYAHIFHDNEFMRDADMTKYLSGLAPKYRPAYRRAMSLTTEDWVVESKLAQDTIVELVHMSRQLKTRIRELMTSADPNARMESARLLTAVLKLDDHIGKAKPDSVNKKIPEHLKQITPEPYKFEEMFQLPAELTDENKSDVG